MKLPWDRSDRQEVKPGEYRRPRSADPYHTARWTRLSKSFRANHPLCAECKRRGKITAATCTDHVVPFPICADFYDVRNLQALCDECNMLKGIKDRERIRRWRVTGKDPGAAEDETAREA